MSFPRLYYACSASRSIIPMRAQGEILSGAGTTESNRLLIGDRFRIKAVKDFFISLFRTTREAYRGLTACLR